MKMARVHRGCDDLQDPVTQPFAGEQGIGPLIHLLGDAHDDREVFLESTVKLGIGRGPDIGDMADNAVDLLFHHLLVCVVEKALGLLLMQLVDIVQIGCPQNGH